MLKVITVVAAAHSMYGANISRKDVNCMATAIYHEARGEDLAGQISVGQVIKNRVASKRHPNNVCAVVYKPYQFTDVDKANPDRSSKSWDKAVKLSSLILSDEIKDPTMGSTMYHNPITAPSPRWDFTKLKLAINIGNHRFYKEV